MRQTIKPLAALLLISCGPAAQPQQPLRIAAQDTLSTGGSTRATAYSMSNKIITAGEKIFVSWLDHIADIRIREFNRSTETWGETVHLGTGVDNHSGPAIVMDSKGILHAVYGPHHHPFQYKHALAPNSIDGWSAEEKLGVSGTYPSLVIDDADGLHLAYRGSGQEPWLLTYQHKPPGGEWSDPLGLVHPGVDSGYTQYANSLAFGPDGVLHLGFHIYDLFPPAGKSVGYLKSPDRGKSWQNAVGEPVQLPADPSSPCFIERGDSLDMRIDNVAVDPDGQPWLVATHLETTPRHAVLWHHDGRDWRAVPLLPEIQKHVPGKGISYTNVAFDAEGTLYLASMIENIETETFWGDLSQEVIMLVSRDRGATFQYLKISEPDPALPNWMPNLERPVGTRLLPGPPSLLYTHGDRGVGVTGGAATEVIFVRFE